MLAQLIHTPRLRLVAATPTSLQTELDQPNGLGEYLRAALPADWPPDYHDRAAVELQLQLMLDGGAAAAGWFSWYVLYGSVAPELVGCGGYGGPPDAAGNVEVSCSVTAGWRRQGFATEVLRALLARVSAHPPVQRIVARPAPDCPASLGVLRRCGFQLIEPDTQPDQRLFAYSEH
ncbi:GNAT family N-acetyltransferase [Hymenobacter sp. B81]|uniref:GNAT family N-acetyltransferase n=1 Tax=Hymenobacter sp. B81 TaxID=3344878 RepID=UPI0037DC0D33